MIEMIQGNIRIIELLKMLTQGFIWRNLYGLSRILLHFPGICLAKKIQLVFLGYNYVHY